MDNKQFIKYILNMVKGCRHPNQTMNILLLNGFKELNRGAWKRVYYNSDYPTWVIKVFKRRTGWYHDHSTCGIMPKTIKKYWLSNIYVCRRFVIQPYANGIGGTSKEAKQMIDQEIPNSYENYDIWSNNVMFHNNRPVVIDYSHKKNKRHKFRWPTLI